MISVRQPVVGKHMSVKPAAEKTHEAQKRRGEERRKKVRGNEKYKNKMRRNEKE